MLISRFVQCVRTYGSGELKGVNYNWGMNTCPYCLSAVKQHKAGLNHSGSQRYECGVCGRKYTPVPQPHGYPIEVRQEALALYVDGMNLRRIGRTLKVDHQTVANWVNAQAASLPAAPLPTEIPMAVNELDEVLTFVGEKKRRVPRDQR